ncbi:hypothetical protein SERLADRAFT_408897 [Serpula lacrymans var. lacrymans S7.9]|uniref:Uncharacterized protein n=1 Tax=Serpula lacrymans var. lacrymans (strain S7.9) TaxID=578457 RepID=F8P0I9_SERL9|nr:uncharacterized protein SERLADRAFT_408897 [Serpula lacrymans var. lacrymans S7.9]EGO23544.1 hypothetical protein SERLADRAFT_408897 [Serpula lacrymans var. lacrymans S7.9]
MTLKTFYSAPFLHLRDYCPLLKISNNLSWQGSTHVLAKRRVGAQAFKEMFPTVRGEKKTMVVSMANQEVLEKFVQKVNNARETLRSQEPKEKNAQCARSSPSDHYHIAASSQVSHDLTEWLSTHRDDPTAKNFFPQLKDHLLARLCGLAYNGDEYEFSDEDQNCVLLHNNKIFEHNILQHYI